MKMNLPVFRVSCLAAGWQKCGAAAVPQPTCESVFSVLAPVLPRFFWLLQLKCLWQRVKGTETEVVVCFFLAELPFFRLHPKLSHPTSPQTALRSSQDA